MPNESQNQPGRPRSRSRSNPPKPSDRPNLPESPSEMPYLRGGPMGSVLMNAISRMESAPRVRESLALAYWPRVAGAQGAAATRAESVRDGILTVRTKSSTWSHELTLHKAHLLLGLNRLLGGKIITDIRFRAQGVKQEETDEETDTPSAEELALVVLEPPE